MGARFDVYVSAVARLLWPHGCRVNRHVGTWWPISWWTRPYSIRVWILLCSRMIIRVAWVVYLYSILKACGDCRAKLRGVVLFYLWVQSIGAYRILYAANVFCRMIVRSMHLILVTWQRFQTSNLSMEFRFVRTSTTSACCLPLHHSQND